MRTTVDITDQQHEALIAIARLRSLRGFSVLVQEALDSYLADQLMDATGLESDLEGSLTEAEAREMRARIESATAVWRTT